MSTNTNSRAIYEGYNDALSSVFNHAPHKSQFGAVADAVITATEDFLADNAIVNTVRYDVHDPKVVCSMEALSDSNWDVASHASIKDLLDRACIPQDQQYEAAQAVACLLARWKSCGGDNEIGRAHV